MSLNAKAVAGKQTNKKPTPVMEAGTYPARLVQVIDLGVQPQKAYQGKEKPPVQQISLTYEFTDEFLKDEDGNDREDKPRWLSEMMPLHNLKADRAKSTKRYYALDPKEDAEGDFTRLLGAPVNIVVGEYTTAKGVQRNKVEDATPMRAKEAAKVPELVNEPTCFVLDEPDMDVFYSLPEFLQDLISSNLEYQGSALQEALEGDKKAKEEDPMDEPEDDEDQKDEPELPDEEDEENEELPW